MYPNPRERFENPSADLVRVFPRKQSIVLAWMSGAHLPESQDLGKGISDVFCGEVASVQSPGVV
jgi:hypothetical protein